MNTELFEIVDKPIVVEEVIQKVARRNAGANYDFYRNGS